MHEHVVCEHEFKYCKVCDTVYCEKCKKEWKAPVQFSTWYDCNTYVESIPLQTISIANHTHDS